MSSIITNTNNLTHLKNTLSTTQFITVYVKSDTAATFFINCALNVSVTLPITVLVSVPVIFSSLFPSIVSLIFPILYNS